MIMKNLSKKDYPGISGALTPELKRSIDTAYSRVQAYEVLFPLCWRKQIPQDEAHEYIALECHQWSGLTLDERQMERLETFRTHYGNILQPTLSTLLHLLPSSDKN